MPNLKTTLGRRFLFDRITTVILLSNVALQKLLLPISKKYTQGWFKARLALHWNSIRQIVYNLISKSSIQKINKATGNAQLPFQPESIYAISVY